jgi:two-component system cell cycle sensor histidine kinase/response regulator CckA
VSGEYSGKSEPIPPGSYVRIDVTDTGIGMDRDIMEKIFEPFFSTKGEMGTGLGLSTVYGIVRQNEGYITVESEKGTGSTFSIFLPRSAAGALEGTREFGEPGIQEPEVCRETILIVEDEDYVRKLLVRTLSAQGYTVLEASNSSDALTVCAPDQQAIDLILSDIVLPDMPGPQLVEKVRLIRPGIRVLYMSGYAEHKIINTEVLREGVFFIPKPFLPSELHKKIREVLAAT